MNVFIIQPPDAPTVLPVMTTERPGEGVFSPPWNVLCMQAFLQKHTRHICQFVDCRLMTDVEHELVAHIEQLAPPRIVVVNAPILLLGQVAAVLEIVKRHFPSMRTVLCGEYPSAFPEHVVDIPRVDYALSGDPEPILRNLLDYLDVEQRLRRTPGLIMSGTTKPTPHWLARLQPLALPDWDGIYWTGYAAGPLYRPCRAGIRVSRGHSKSPVDRAWGESGQPLRCWPLDRMASLVNRCSHTEISEVALLDPPGFWSEEQVAAWVGELLRIRNAQPWSLVVHPVPIAREIIADLRETNSRRVEMIFPSCHRDVLARFDLRMDGRPLERTLQHFSDSGIHVLPRFWIGGPDEPAGEEERIAQTIRRLGFTDYRIEPFPYHLDSAVYEEQLDAGMEPALAQWIKWSRDPWIMEQPMPLWRGHEGIPYLHQELQLIRKSLQRSPAILWARIQKAMRSRNWIELLEDKTIQLLQRHRRTSV